MAGYLSGIEALAVKSSNGIVNKILTFLYTIGHQIGVGFVKFFNLILPNIRIPETLIDPIGVLALLTLFCILFQAARKIAWIVLIIGWILIVVRLILIALKVG